MTTERKTEKVSDRCPCGHRPSKCKGWEDAMGQHKCPLMPRYQFSGDATDSTHPAKEG
jgi:hypothetical protein